MTINKQYRIHRLDPRNIAIQKWIVTDKSQAWRTISYHGNSVKSLVSGLLALVVQQHSPEDIELREQLKMLGLDIVSEMANIREMIRKYCKDIT